ncbi:hypothetical protein BDZ94DRAFT_1302196 [Collybia nuda]|uniref:Uncharacterized protein n=1 Tax=Collybia nuda TaxID=64659 RepID=A0A9P6C962_9AGAR|nr:hypothetical protein BDZ94DRAFT_1302196 [Collybia nuda]
MTRAAIKLILLTSITSYVGGQATNDTQSTTTSIPTSLATDVTSIRTSSGTTPRTNTSVPPIALDTHSSQVYWSTLVFQGTYRHITVAKPTLAGKSLEPQGAPNPSSENAQSHVTPIPSTQNVITATREGNERQTSISTPPNSEQGTKSSDTPNRTSAPRADSPSGAIKTRVSSKMWNVGLGIVASCYLM